MKIIEFKNELFDEYPRVTNENPPKIIYRFEYRPLSNEIYLPDKTLDQHYNHTLTNNSAKYAMHEIVDILKTRCNTQIDTILNKYQIVLFFLLHEKGHWNHCKRDYLEKGLTSDDYLKHYKRLKLEFEYELKNKFTKEQSQSKEAYEYLAREYRKLEFEKIADDYAIKRINENRELLKWFNEER